VLTASLTCIAIAAVFVGGGFTLGRFYERQQPQAPVPSRHPSHHHRPARSARTVNERRHLRVVAPIFDFEQNA
jgi:hypothetical protein